MLNLEEQLKSDISKQNVNYIVHTLGNNEQYFKQLWDIIKRDEYKISVMAVWIWDSIIIKYPEMFNPYLVEAIEILHKFKLDGTKRLLLKIIVRYNIEENLKGRLFNLCVKYLMDPKEPVAIKVHSMQIMYNISQTEPDLKPEIIDIIEYQYEFNSIAYKSRADKLLKKLFKETR